MLFGKGKSKGAAKVTKVNSSKPHTCMKIRETFSCSCQPFWQPLLQVASGARGTKEASQEDTNARARRQRHEDIMDLEEPAGKRSHILRSANEKEAGVKVCLHE